MTRVGLRKLARWATVVAASGIVIFMFRRFEQSQVYHPSRSFRVERGNLPPDVEDVWLRTADGVNINAWFFPAKTNSVEVGTHYVVVLSHGNAGNMGDRMDICSLWLSAGVSVLLFDYRGYGRSEGKPSEEGTYLDAQAAYAWVRKRGYVPEKVISYGESLGGGVAAELALRERVGALVLQSTFTSIPDIGAELFPFLPVRWISRIKYDTLSKLPRLRIPVMVVHGRSDALIRFGHAERNFAAANQPKLLWEIEGDHNDGILDRHHFLTGAAKLISLMEEASRTAGAEQLRAVSPEATQAAGHR